MKATVQAQSPSESQSPPNPPPLPAVREKEPSPPPRHRRHSRRSHPSRPSQRSRRRRRKITRVRTVLTMLRRGTCSNTTMTVLDRAHGHPLGLEEHATDPLAGGLMMGYQCGMLWGSTLAAGARAHRRLGPGPRAEAVALRAAQGLVGTFRGCHGHTNCLEITETDPRNKWQTFTRFFLKGEAIRCFGRVARYAPLAHATIEAALDEAALDEATFGEATFGEAAFGEATFGEAPAGALMLDAGVRSPNPSPSPSLSPSPPPLPLSSPPPLPLSSPSPNSSPHAGSPADAPDRVGSNRVGSNRAGDDEAAALDAGGPVSCAAMLARRLGASEAHTTMAAGLGGGIGLSGGACGALGAATWLLGIGGRAEGLSNKAIRSRIEQVTERFQRSADYELECATIVGRRFEGPTDHGDHLSGGGCAALLESLAVAVEEVTATAASPSALGDAPARA